MLIQIQTTSAARNVSVTSVLLKYVSLLFSNVICKCAACLCIWLCGVCL